MTFTYPERHSPALQGVSFAVQAGQLAVVSGRNGAGKSTLAMAVNGTIPHLIRGTGTGLVRISGRPAGPPRELAQDVGVVFQDFESHLVSSSVALEVAFPLENLGVDPAEQRRRVSDTLALVGLAGFEERAPVELSGGEKQRLAIAAAIALKPDVLVLDEPLTDLDPVGKTQVLNVIAQLRAQGMTVLLIEHDPQALLAADTLLLLKEGRLAYAGPPGDILINPQRCADLGLPVWPPALVAQRLGLPGGDPSIDAIASRIKAQRLSPHPTLFPQEERGKREKGEGSGETHIEFRGVTSGYPGGPDVLHDVSLAFRAGECVALLGQNGSGKTALAKHAVGLIKLRRGELLVKGKSVKAYTLSDLSRTVGYVFQNPDHQIFSDTVADEVAFGARNLGLNAQDLEVRVREALEAVGLSGRERDDPFALAKGERQRLAVASLLAYRPEAVFFDEPTTGLDAAEAESMMIFIRGLNALGMTVILITHAMWVAAEYADRVVVLAQGRVAVDGPSREVFAREEVLRGLSLSPPPAAALANRLGVNALSATELLEALGPPRHSR